MATKKTKNPETAPVETAEAPVEATEAPVAYSLEELQRAAIFAGRHDLLTALIKDGERLTLAQAQERIDDFSKRKVD